MYEWVQKIQKVHVLNCYY